MPHPTISVTDLAATLVTTPQATVIDVRTPHEFALVHAVPATNLPLPEVSAVAMGKLGHSDKTAPIYVLCQTGRRALAASDALVAAGFAQPVVVTGGTVAWEAAGLPVKRRRVFSLSLERQIRIAAGSLVLLGIVGARNWHPGFLWLSGFVGAGLVFAGATDICGMGLLLARAPWNKR